MRKDLPDLRRVFFNWNTGVRICEEAENNAQKFK